MGEQLAIEDQGQPGPHVHRDLVALRDEGGARIAQVCPGCFGLFDAVTGNQLKRGTGKWQAAVEQMRTDLAAADEKQPGAVGALVRWLRRQQ